MDFSDLSEDAVWRRHQDELDALPNRGEMSALSGMRCLKCGHGIEMSKHFGHVYTFDARTETLHTCKPTYNESMARVRQELRREELK